MSSPPEKKRRKKTTEKPSLMPLTTPNPSLPDDLLVSCLARVSRLYYPTLSLVSKSFRSLLASPDFYKIRYSLGKTESCLYVCLRINSNLGSWFTLCRKPDKTLTNATSNNKKSSGYVLATIPNPHPHYLEVNEKSTVALGSNIYTIGGPIGNKPSSCVSILDCQSNTWHEAPRMRVEREFASANVLDGKIYVAGGRQDFSFTNWMEVFDPQKQAWELVSGPGAEITSGCNSREESAVIDGKIIYIFGSRKALVYEPKEDKWVRMVWEMDFGWAWYAHCVIENVVYYYDNGEFKWYDIKVRRGSNLRGVIRVIGLPMFAQSHIRLVDYGGKMAVLWRKTLELSGDKDKMICCAVIALERRNSKEIWGKVEWHGEVLKVPKSWDLEYALAATVW